MSVTLLPCPPFDWRMAVYDGSDAIGRRMRLISYIATLGGDPSHRARWAVIASRGMVMVHELCACGKPMCGALFVVTSQSEMEAFIRDLLPGLPATWGRSVEWHLRLGWEHHLGLAREEGAPRSTPTHTPDLSMVLH
jgi:hypothetical protein